MSILKSSIYYICFLVCSNNLEICSNNLEMQKTLFLKPNNKIGTGAITIVYLATRELWRLGNQFAELDLSLCSSFPMTMPSQKIMTEVSRKKFEKNIKQIAAINQLQIDWLL